MPTNRTTMTAWITAARPVAHGMIALPLLWGQALAWVATQQFDWLWFLIIQLFGAGCQIYCLYLNDYADEATDRLNRSYWLSGGSRVIPNGQLSGRQLYRASFVVLVGLLALSGLAYQLERSVMPALTLLAVGLGWSYSLPPLQSSYRGYGEFHQAISCGVVLPVMAFYLQSGSLAAFPWLLLFPVALLFFAGNIVTSLPDLVSDKRSNKRSYPVRHGYERAHKDAIAVLFIAYTLGFVVNQPWASYWLSNLTIFGPALLLLVNAQRIVLTEPEPVKTNPNLKRFILLLSLSQAWVMALWTGWLYWHGIAQP